MTKLWLFWVFVVLWVCDTVLTMMFVTKFGFEMEANPVPRFIMENAGLIGFGAFKAVMLAPLVAIWKHMYKWVYAVLIAIMVPVVYLNMIVAFDLYAK